MFSFQNTKSRQTGTLPELMPNPIDNPEAKTLTAKIKLFLLYWRRFELAGYGAASPQRKKLGKSRWVQEGTMLASDLLRPHHRGQTEARIATISLSLNSTVMREFYFAPWAKINSSRDEHSGDGPIPV
jgi:hypothetical protein